MEAVIWGVQRLVLITLAYWAMVGVATADTNPPVLNLGGPSVTITNSGSVVYALNYADTNFSNSTLAAANITLNSTGTANASSLVVAGSGTNRTVTLSGLSGDGTLGISVAAGTAVDTSGNLSAAAGPSTTFIVDTTLPTIAFSAPSVTYTNAGSVVYTVTYTDSHYSASTLVSTNVSLNKTGTANATTVTIAGTGNTRTVTLTGLTGDGTIGISLAANTASDTAGNKAAAAGPSSTFTVDKTVPAIAVSAPSATFTGGSAVSYTVTYTDVNFNASTLVAPNITLNKTGTANATNVVVSGIGNTRTVTLSGFTGAGTVGITVGANTASDLAGNLAPASAASGTFTVDLIAPTLVIGAPSVTVTNGGSVTYTATYADANFASSTLALANITVNTTGTAAASSVTVSGSGLTRTVTLTGLSGNGTLV